jgi:membrane fusion protein, multidrug efflux system
MLDRPNDKSVSALREEGEIRSEQAPDLEERRDENASSIKSGKQEARPEQTRPRRGRKFITFLIVAAIVLGFGYAGSSYWLANRDIETTDDSYTDGRAITIAPEVSGKVVSLDVTDNEFVREGQPLIHIGDRQYQIDRESAEGSLAAARAQLAALQYAAEVARKNFPAALKQAQAQLDAAKAALAANKAVLAKAEADYKRQQGLPRQATTQQEVDAATSAWRQAQAQVAQGEAQIAQGEAQVAQAEPVKQRIGQAEAQVQDTQGQVEQAQARLDQALLNIERCIVRAPQDGWITKRNAEKGSYVSPGQPLLSIVSPEVWITANFKESQLDLMRPGQPVTIEVDAYPSLHLEGHVDSVQLGSGSKFTAFPPENATGNFVKIVQRIPVKIVIDKGLDPKLPLPLGLSVDPRVKVK